MKKIQEDYNTAYEITERIRDKFSFKTVSIGSFSEHTYFVEITYDGITWKCLEIYKDEPIYETFKAISYALINNDWFDTYVLSSQTLLLESVFSEYHLQNFGYFRAGNTFFYESNGECKEIVYSPNIKNIEISFAEDENDFKCIIIKTANKKISLNYDGFKVEKPNISRCTKR